MTDVKKARVREIFGEAAELSGDAQREFLDDRCGEDPQLRAEVVTLLELEPDVATPFLGGVERSTIARDGRDAPDRIGPYKILEQAGEGGMGVVYLAEQTEPVHRRVALKIIKLGMDSRRVVARFEAERQALAMMDHANVAKVFDAGATDTGRPYFVMEHVPGVPITQHCDRQRLTIDERLELFMQICGAIQHAHQKGIIHRDIKPSNILVSADGAPKVIDFGVAKALHQKLAERTVFTEQGQLIGTPEYMSPEQAEMSAQDVDTRSDIYSLGVLLYELLTGERPFSSESLREAGLAEIQRVIREEEPKKPSTRLSESDETSTTNATRRRSDPRTLARLLRGDLDWIVMKAMEKDRSRRYETANGLAEDLQRHLSHEPVQARPPSASYRIRKFVRRNRIGVTAATVVLLVLLAGITGTTWGLISAKHQAKIASDARDGETAAKAEAEQRAAELERVADFQASQLDGIDAALMASRLREDLLTEARAAMERTGLDNEAIAERTRQLEDLLAGTNLTNVALKALNRNIFERALKAAHDEFPTDDLIRARLLHTLSGTLAQIGLLEASAAPLAEALDIRRRILGDEHPETLYLFFDKGLELQARGKAAEAEWYFRSALDICRRVFGDGHPDTLRAIAYMGFWLQANGPSSAAEVYLREALEGRRSILGDDHPETLESLNNMAVLLKRQGKLSEAEVCYRDLLEADRRVQGEEHRYTLITASNLGVLLEAQGKLVQARELQSETLTVRRRVLGDNHRDTLDSIQIMANLLWREGEAAEAERLCREALEGRRRTLGDDHPATLESANSMAVLLNAQGRYGDSEPLLRESIDNVSRELGADHWRIAEARSLLGEAIAGQERFDAAEPLLLYGHAGLDSAVPRGRRALKLPPSIERLVRLYEAWGKPDEAAKWRKKLEEVTQDVGSKESSPSEG